MKLFVANRTVPVLISELRRIAIILILMICIHDHHRVLMPRVGRLRSIIILVCSGRRFDVGYVVWHWLHILNCYQLVEHLLLVLDELVLEDVCCRESVYVSLMAHNLLFNDTLTEFKLIDAVNEAFLRNKVAHAVH